MLLHLNAITSSPDPISSHLFVCYHFLCFPLLFNRVEILVPLGTDIIQKLPTPTQGLFIVLPPETHVAPSRSPLAEDAWDDFRGVDGGVGLLAFSWVEPGALLLCVKADFNRSKVLFLCRLIDGDKGGDWGAVATSAACRWLMWLLMVWKEERSERERSLKCGSMFLHQLS